MPVALKSRFMVLSLMWFSSLALALASVPSITLSAIGFCDLGLLLVVDCVMVELAEENAEDAGLFEAYCAAITRFFLLSAIFI